MPCFKILITFEPVSEILSTLVALLQIIPSYYGTLSFLIVQNFEELGRKLKWLPFLWHTVYIYMEMVSDVNILF